MKTALTVSVTLLCLAGCASVKMGDAGKDAAAKTFVAPKDGAGIYIYRNETMGAAVKMDVALDGSPIGQTAAKTYFYREVRPGKHVVTSVAENSESLEIDAEPGVLYYVWQEVKMGILRARNKLQLVDENVGKQGVLESKLAESN